MLLIPLKKMCEVIFGSGSNAEKIFNYSPSGELVKVFEWYEAAKEILENKHAST